MSPLSRRQLLALGAAGAAARAGPGCGGPAAVARPSAADGSWCGRRCSPAATGSLDLALEAAPARVRIGAREAHVQAFSGSLPGPTLRVGPEDTLRVAMTNRLEAPTNLHGLHVSRKATATTPS